MKIAIIGCGYIGSAVATKWENKGHEVTRCSRSLKDGYFLLTENRVQDFTQLIDTNDVIVLTMAAGKSGSYKETYLDNALALKQAGIPKQILYTSSTSIYGDHGGDPVDESTVPNPSSESGKILLRTEEVLLSIPSQVCIFRLGEIYGPRRTTADRLKRMAGRELPGDGTSLINRIHQKDVICALSFALNEPLAGIYNLCHDEHLPRKEFYNKLCKENGLPDMKWNPEQKSPHAGNKRVSNDKIKSKGFKFKHPTG